jgi:hypothetical protein
MSVVRLAVEESSIPSTQKMTMQASRHTKPLLSPRLISIYSCPSTNLYAGVKLPVRVYAGEVNRRDGEWREIDVVP